MTNREWLQSLSDIEFAKFCIGKLPVRSLIHKNALWIMIGALSIGARSDPEINAIIGWLNEPKEFEVIKE